MTPRFIPTCSPELLSGLGDLAAKYDCIVQSHCSESVDEVAFTKALHPHEGSDTDIFAKHGLLRNAVMAHSVFCSEADLLEMKSQDCSISHCPLSNFYFAKGLLNVPLCREVGTNVSLGTDVAGGYCPSMLSSMKNAVVSSRCLAISHSTEPISWEYAFYLATMGGASATRQPIGCFEVGNKVDAVFWDGSGGGVIDIFPRDSTRDVFEKIMKNGDERLISMVMVNGDVVHPR